MNFLRKGLLISFEGIDGSGKSTQIDKLYDYLVGRGHTVCIFFEPTKGKWGQKCRVLFKKGHIVPSDEEVQYFVNDRKEDVEENILPALNQGKIVLQDRYYDSNAAYQGALGIGMDKIIKINNFAPEPDLTILFVVPTQTATNRIQNHREEKLNQFENPLYLKKVQDNYLELAHIFNSRITKVNANDHPEKIFKSILTILKPNLSRWEHSK